MSHRADERLSCLDSTVESMCRSQFKNVADEFVLTLPPVISMSCSSYLDGLCDGR